MEGKENYFSTVLETFASGDKRINLKNAVGYITNYEVKDRESMAYFIYATNKNIGVQVIIVGELDSMQEIQKEIESVISSLQFEN